MSEGKVVEGRSLDGKTVLGHAYLGPVQNPSTIEVSSTIEDGSEWRLIGNANLISISNDVEFETVCDSMSAIKYPVTQSFTLTAELSPEGYKIITGQPMPKRKVERTVRTTAFDSTVSEIEAARVAAGVPEDAKVFLTRSFRDELVGPNLDNPEPIEVEFRWKEEV